MPEIPASCSDIQTSVAGAEEARQCGARDGGDRLFKRHAIFIFRG